ncbi:hypothetical protein [Paenibacillus methanolicus]|uniref:Uncharacterized protein n=1 Tax=Paenibacillus methanolicus TaxID=582686 RepID=A0A5S5BRZ9_9BACL|nr:hypothetical protein [Paenibacillus methanolicus]TYP68353.1 hypothetical protein BCM02_11937 [Paenibacillus methanolicus]
MEIVGIALLLGGALVVGVQSVRRGLREKKKAELAKGIGLLAAGIAFVSAILLFLWMVIHAPGGDF